MSHEACIYSLSLENESIACCTSMHSHKFILPVHHPENSGSTETHVRTNYKGTRWRAPKRNCIGGASDDHGLEYRAGGRRETVTDPNAFGHPPTKYTY